MTKIFYQSSVLKHTVVPACENSMKIMSDTLADAQTISFPRELGFKEIVQDLKDFQQRHQYFLSWVSKCDDGFVKHVEKHEQSIHLIPSVEIINRTPLVK